MNPESQTSIHQSTGEEDRPSAPEGGFGPDVESRTPQGSETGQVFAESLLDESFQSLDPRNIQVELIAGLIFASVVMVALLVGVVAVGVSVGLTWLFWSVLAAAMALGTLVFLYAILWPRLDYRYTRYRLDQHGLEIRRGVLWRQLATVPLGRVQHADVGQGPLQRMFGVGTLTVHTAGTQNASVALEGLAHEHAVRLRDLIVHQRGEFDAV